MACQVQGNVAIRICSSPEDVNDNYVMTTEASIVESTSKVVTTGREEQKAMEEHN